jgi:RHS repeat-associated protein
MNTKYLIQVFAASLTMLFSLAANSTEAPNDKTSALIETIAKVKAFGEPVIHIGNSPSEKESALLLENLNLASSDAGKLILALETFIVDNPKSAWVPSLRANLAYYYRLSGRYSQALEHWESAWNATKDFPSGNEKRIADYTIANWTHLLASLGRVNELEKIFQETNGRVLGSRTLQKRLNDTKEGLATMRKNPDIAYKCGTFALLNVGRSLKLLSPKTMQALMDIPSPTTGFSMTVLAQYAKEFKLDLVPVKRVAGTEIAVPSVVHWKQSHYAAIIEKKNDRYHVIDPTFGSDKWLSATVIEEECSGYFMVSSEKVGSGWQLLDQTDTDLIFGKGYPNDKPPCPPDCPTCCAPGGGGTGSSGSPGNGNGNQGGPIAANPLWSGQAQSPDSIWSGQAPSSGSLWSPSSSGCQSCGGAGSKGMASWRVVEPYVELWVDDTPISYQPSRGKEVSVRLTFHQNENREDNTNIFNFGPSWNCNWLTYIDVIGETNDPTFSNYVATLYAPGGGQSQFTNNYTEPETRTRARFDRIFTGTNLTGFSISYPDASKAIYGLVEVVSAIPRQSRGFLTEWISAEGFTNSYRYSTNTGILLTNVVDVDGKTNQLIYDTNFPSQVSRVIDPYTNEVRFYYATNGMLTNIVDPVNISSQFRYTESNGVPLMTNMVTPYGVTLFEYFGPGTTNTVHFGANTIPDTDINTVIRVTEPTGGKHLFMYRDKSIWLGVDEELEPIPFISITDTNEQDRWDTTPYFAHSGLMDNLHLYFRNSFYWGPLQHQGLPEDFTTFAVSDYEKGRMRHWLHGARNGAMIWGPQVVVSHTMSMEREPSPDGIVEGRKTWYGFTGNEVTYCEGTNVWPNVMAYTIDKSIAPVASTNLYFIYKEYNRLANVTLSIETYSSGSGVDLRTNVYEYATNDVDMVQHTLLVNGTPVLQESNIYNSFHQVVTNYDAKMQVTSYTYDTNRLLTLINRPSGLTTSNSYYANGQLKESIDVEIGRANSYSYENGRIKTHTNELGLVKIFHWDALNRLTGVSFPDGTTTNLYHLPPGVTLSGGTGTNILDVTATRDKLSNWTYFAYNGIRQRIAVTNALTNSTFYNYCTCGALDSIEDALGNETHFHYDNAGRLTIVTNADNYVVTNRFSSSGRLTNTTDSAGVRITNSYNVQGLLIAVSNSFGLVQSMAFDIEDQITNSIDANGVSIDTTYDELGRVLTRKYPDDGVEQFAYSPRGLTIYTNQLEQTNYYAYNEAGWKTFETNANGEVTQFRYDQSGNLTNLLDGRMQSTKWFYDQYSRVTNKVDHNTNSMFIYGYNPNGWLTNRWTPQKTNTLYSYDSVGNLTNVNYATSTDLQFKYDALNRVTNMTDSVGTTKFGYTAGGFLAFEDGPWASDTVSYSYENRKRSGMSILAPNSSAWSQTYAYDKGNRLTNIISPAGSFVYTYQPSLDGVTTASSLIKQLALPNGANITNDFDLSGRLLKTHLRGSTNGLLNKHEYGYNVGNERTQQVFTASNYVNYAYDNIGQLKTAFGYESNSTARLHEQFGYAYDAAGNLNVRTNNALIQNFGVNSLNQLSNITRNATNTLTVAGTTTSTATNVTVNTNSSVLYLDRTFASTNHILVDGSNSFTAIAMDSLGRRDTNSITVYLPTNAFYTHDLNGNLTNDLVKVFEYDDENQLTRITKTGEWKAEFAYDGKMRRRIERNYEWLNSTWVRISETRFVYDGNLPVQERNENNLLEVTLTRGRDLSGSFAGGGGIGGLLGLSQYSNIGAQHIYYHSDGNGNVTMLLDAFQNISAKFIYDPFGKILSKSGQFADANRYQFSSKPIHQLSGTYDYLYRWYAPEIQRWLNRDPVEEIGFEQIRRAWITLNHSPNLYSFVQNQPTGKFDLFGLYDKQTQDAIDKCLEMGKSLGKKWTEDCVQNAMDGKPPPCPLPKNTGKPSVWDALKNLLKLLKRWRNEGHPGE